MCAYPATRPTSQVAFWGVARVTAALCPAQVALMRLQNSSRTHLPASPPTPPPPRLSCHALLLLPLCLQTPSPLGSASLSAHASRMRWLAWCMTSQSTSSFFTPAFSSALSITCSGKMTIMQHVSWKGDQRDLERSKATCMSDSNGLLHYHSRRQPSSRPVPRTTPSTNLLQPPPTGNSPQERS